MRDRTRRRVNWTALGVAVSVGASIVMAAAQGRGAAPPTTRGPGWTARPTAAQRFSGLGLTATERTVLEARFAEYERLFAAPESMARPQGFLARPGMDGGLSEGPLGVPSFGYYIVIAPDLRERPAAMSIRENPVARHVWIVDNGPPTLRDAAGDIYLERPTSGSLPGMSRNALVFGGLKVDRQTEARINSVSVLLTSDGELPWSDVSRERVVKIFIAEATAGFKTVEQQASESSYQRWLREAPARQRDREQMLAAVASVDKAQVAKTRADLERADREAGESYKKTEAPEREQAARNLAAAKGRLSQVSGQLAEMSATERAMPAWVQPNPDGTYKFAVPGTEGFHHLIADKPDYYRFKGSRVQLRSLLITFRIQEYTGEEQADRAVADSYKAFDWTAAARLLSGSTK